MKFIERKFGPGETIRGVIKKVNSHGCSERMLKILMMAFNEMNELEVPKPGKLYKIPVFDGFLGVSKETKEQLCGDNNV